MTELNGVWHRQGVLAMLRQSLHRLALPARWLAEPEGERRLTNVLQVAELPAGRFDPPSMVNRRCCAGFRSSAPKPLPASSTATTSWSAWKATRTLVQVVTVHKSKGLEYPVVCLPFATTFIGASAGRNGFVLQRASGGARVPIFDPRRCRHRRSRARCGCRKTCGLLYVAADPGPACAVAGRGGTEARKQRAMSVSPQRARSLAGRGPRNRSGADR